MSKTETKKPQGQGPMRGGGQVVDKPKDMKKTYKQLLEYAKAYRIAMIVVVVFAVLSTVFMIVGPKISGEATTLLADGLLSKAGGKGSINFGRIQEILVFLLGLYLVSTVSSYIQNLVMAEIAQKISYKMRKDVSEKLNRLPLSYYDKTSQGDVLSRVTNDIETISTSLNQSMTQVITSIVSVVGIIVMMLTISWMMTIVAMLVLPISGIFVMQIAKRSQKHFDAQQKSLGEVNGHVEEMYGGHIIVKAFNGEEDSLIKFNEHNDELYTSAWKSQFLSGLMMPVTQLIGNLGYVAVCLVGGILAINSSVSILGITFAGVGLAIGDIQAFIQYVNLFNQPISQAAQIVNMLQSTAAASERVFELLNETEESADTATPAVMFDENGKNIIDGTVTFEQVKFGYNPDKIVINDFSMRVGQGQKIAIVGPTGAGKTTIVKLLMRFYELNDGAIYVGDTDIKDFTRSDLRSMFSMVLQDAWLFNGSVMENLRYSKLDATDEEVYHAAKMARVDHFVKTLENGYETELNEETSNISQGQKQLLTIARAFLADPKILILDEATSNVDTRTEVLIQEGMDNLMKGRTSFVIAHRLSTIRNADVIIVMNEGDIVEIGSDEELLARGGFYAQLYASQFQNEAE